MNNHKIKTDLIPLLETGSWFDFKKAEELISKWLKDNIVFNSNEKKFIECFKNKEYKPELLFDDKEIVERIKNHPMALWKTRK